MNNTLQEADQLVADVIRLLEEVALDDVTVIFSPPFPFIISPCLTNIITSKNKDNIFVAAQNCSSEGKGAFTGEVSARMIHSAGASFVLVGHSERRQYFKENSELLAKKVDRVLEAGMQAIFCCGEVLDERKSVAHFEVVKKQIEESLFHLGASEFSKVVVAYEPVWAIGTGETATSEQAQEMHAFIRNLLSEKYGEIANDTSILYGGSCKPSNAEELFSQPDIDGGLIGGASLKAEDFVALTKAF